MRMEMESRDSGEQLREMAEKVFQLLERLKLAELAKNKAMEVRLLGLRHAVCFVLWRFIFATATVGHVHAGDDVATFDHVVQANIMLRSFLRALLKVAHSIRVGNDVPVSVSFFPPRGGAYLPRSYGMGIPFPVFLAALEKQNARRALVKPQKSFQNRSTTNASWG